MERVSTARQTSNPSQQFPGGAGVAPGGQQLPGYFDQNGNPVYTTKISTVGSASATGSVSGAGQTTTWASGSNRGDDELSMDTNMRDYDDRDRFSASGMADEDDGMSDDTSLVGFGEGAGSTVSGPTYSRREAGRSGLIGQLHREESFGGSERSVGAGTPEGQNRLGSGSTGVETAERIMRDRVATENANAKPLGTPEEGGLGKFYFEEKK